ncbi:NUDIX hydrolase [Pseudohalocynthiibacter aestuariivivens]|jgi:8-oxo-dGTP pyrophosphatase MutT (NUDIX family)|uniref:NUDIX hydrolase n=1 Tax=Pseudohalocynthiibacter sp. F2068 TaxID=2926418 RepID=UPI001BD38855|nr:MULTISPECIES: NUDIX hydrolase [Pseudohalocynthiibacter]MBS9718666.1 NUDIX hydrolase [Pseudohalocynthiibacter aestuariivivens]MCK0104142.1 NUDIX hydrolase [Pseudohalocynthiibacter sp. F2068]
MNNKLRNQHTTGKRGGSKVTIVNTKQQPIQLNASQKHGVRTQFGALCYRVNNDKVQVLLVTSRGAGRWIIPKGWPMDQQTPASAAAQEAFEEAGVEGKIENICLGIFSYVKSRNVEDELPCVVAVFPMKVKRLLRKFPEAKERNRRWFSVKKAASMVSEPELAQIIRAFEPALLPR